MTEIVFNDIMVGYWKKRWKIRRGKRAKSVRVKVRAGLISNGTESTKMDPRSMGFSIYLSPFFIFLYIRERIYIRCDSMRIVESFTSSDRRSDFLKSKDHLHRCNRCNNTEKGGMIQFGETSSCVMGITTVRDVVWDNMSEKATSKRAPSWPYWKINCNIHIYIYICIRTTV